MVQQKDYAIGKVKKRRVKYLGLVFLAQEEDLPEEIVFELAKHADAASLDLRNLNLRLSHIRLANFSLETFSEEQCLKYFRFRKADIRKVAEIINWGGITEHNRYKRNSTVACCILLRRLASACTWYELEPLFGMRYSHMSEVFWECLEKFTSEWAHLVTTFNSALMISRARMYSEAISSMGAPLDKCNASTAYHIKPSQLQMV